MAKKKKAAETAPDEQTKAQADPELEDPNLFINREIAWLHLNRRIFEEAVDPSQPLLERIKFLAICGSNLDEFFMVRLSGLKRQFEEGAFKLPPDGMNPTEQLVEIRKELKNLLKDYSKCWVQISSELAAQGIRIQKVSELTKRQQEGLREHFKHHIFPTLTPLAMDFSHPFPFISNLSLNLAVVIKEDALPPKYARVKVPNNIFPRLLAVSEDGKKVQPITRIKETKDLSLVLLEDICSSFIDMLFPGLDVIATYPFRTTRDAEIEIQIDQASDLLTAVEEGIESRKTGKPVRLEIDPSMPDHVKNLFARNLELTNDYILKFDGPLGLVDLWQLLKIDRPDLKDVQFLSYVVPELAEDKNLFSAISKKDYCFYYPYDSFQVIVNLLRQAATDPDVLSIKTTLYRIDKDSPIIDALLRARDEDKAVSALVELKAKFDEENNINWARALEEAGVHVVYGVEDLKVHCKLLQIVRKEGDEIGLYSYISTGNFNAQTAKIYGDIAYLTANHDIGTEVAEVFNTLTGYSKKVEFKHLLVSPYTLKDQILTMIQREIDIQRSGGKGYIALKLNGLLDKPMIQALYRASRAGVKVDLNVRALCSLKPGIAGISDNIKETSIISRFLEHARIYYFRNGGEDEVLIGSADLMPRNLYRRIEVVLKVPDQRIKRHLIEWLNVHLADNVKSRRLLPDGSWERVKAKESEHPMNSQEWLIQNRGMWHEKA